MYYTCFLLGFALRDLSQKVFSSFRTSELAGSIATDLSESDLVYSSVQLPPVSIRFLKSSFLAWAFLLRGYAGTFGQLIARGELVNITDFSYKFGCCNSVNSCQTGKLKACLLNQRF